MPIATDDRVYEFGVFEVHVGSRELRRKGVRVRLQEQPFCVLLALLESPGAVVSKETLRSRLWPDDRFVEVDVSISVAVAKLREALGDEASNPRFIETLPRRGYRFLVSVRILRSAAEQAAAVASPQPTPSAPEPFSKSVPAKNRWRTGAIVAVVCVIAAAVAAVFLMRHFTDKPATDTINSLIVADFINSTGDPIFNGSLRRATIVQVSQSPSFQVFSDAAIDDALQGLGRPPAQGRITAEIARQACQPLQAESILSGSVSRQGLDHFVVSIDANRCGDGKRLCNASVQVTGRDQVLDAVGRAVVDIRHDLGESSVTFKRFNVPIEQATTDSLEALNAYRVGSDMRASGKQLEAVPFFKAAIVLDPGFAMAYEQLGSVYSNIGEEKTGALYIQKAFNARDRATEPERYLISGRYFDVVTGELEKALSIYGIWQSTYPRQWNAANAYANDSNLVGRYEAAVSAAQDVVRIQPNHTFGYVNLAIALMGSNRFAEAEKVCDEAIAKRRSDSTLLRLKYQLAYVSGDEHRIEIAAKGLVDDPDYDAVLASAAVAEGRLSQARRILEKANDTARANGLPGVGAGMIGSEAVLLAQFGELAEARRVARTAISEDAGEGGYGQPLIALATAGNQAEAAELERQLDHSYPFSVFNMGVFRPAADGLLAAQQHATAERIKQIMAPAIPYEMGQGAGMLPVYVRAEALLDVKDSAEAEQEFQKLLDHRGVDPTSPYLSLAHLGLARSLEIEGRRDASCVEYREFLRLWEHADSSIPLLIAARRAVNAQHCSIGQ